MSADPYADLARLVGDVERLVAALREAQQQDDALTQLKVRDRLDQLSRGAIASLEAIHALVDWVEESDLPPGLRAALARPGAYEIVIDPAKPELDQSVAPRGPSPASAGETLYALVHTAEMGEAFDVAALDVSTLEPGPQAQTWNGPGPDPAQARVKLRAHAAELEHDVGPHELASHYLTASSARRVAAMLRRAAASLEGEGSSPR